MGIVLSAASTITVPASLGKPGLFDDGYAIAKPRMDWTGSLLGVIGLVLINVAFNLGSLSGWGHPQAYVTLIVGLIAVGGFFWVCLPFLKVYSIH
jgi:hypothetical protein